jgi:hypothetical protein
LGKHTGQNMTIDDVKHIFKDQISSGTDKLWFMLCDKDYQLIERHNPDNLDELTILLDNFTYCGSNGDMPRFVK